MISYGSPRLSLTFSNGLIQTRSHFVRVNLFTPSVTLPLGEYERQYSNNDTPDALKGFWENYNPAECSLCELDYKYNGKLT
jgi:hypothetical protein